MKRRVDEKHFYPEIRSWLERSLKSKYPRYKSEAYITSEVKLSEFLFRSGFSFMISDYDTYEFKADLVGLITDKEKCDLVLVECKRRINLQAIAQLVGYSKIVQPRHAFLISVTNFLTPAASKLLLERKRHDILEFAKNSWIRVIKWDHQKKDIAYDKVIPRGDIFE